VKLSYEDHGAITVVTISGELTVDQADAFRRAIGDRFEAGARDFILNIEHLTLIDSAGLELLLWLLDELADRGGQVRLVKPDETVNKILELTRLERRFSIHNTLEAAGKSLR
jgi:anti-sigma B factor antagonist